MLLKGLLTVILVFAFCLIADAQATRTWVSGVGDDVNPCSRTAPCKTFAGAISKTATNGEINCLDPAGYGAITVTKSITIDCEDTQGSILNASTTGVIVNIAAATDTKKSFKIRGVAFNGAGTGIHGVRILAANSVVIEDVVIDGNTQDAVHLANGGDVRVVIRNSSFRSNAGSAIKAAPLPTGSADITVVNSLLAFNGGGIAATGKTTVRISGNSVVFNATGLSATGTGAAIISLGNNLVNGNGIDGSPTSTVPPK